MNMKLSTKISKEIGTILEKNAKEVCKDLAKKCEKELTQEYMRVIDIFYGEYTPTYYKRHDPGGYYSTNIPYYANPSGTVFYGGVKISPDAMPHHQHSNNEVLSSFMEGYHGPEFVGIYGIEAYQQMINYKNSLVANITP